MISVSEKAPAGESNDAVAAAEGSVRAERAPGVVQRSTVKTVHAEVLNASMMHGTSLIAKLVPSENHPDFERLMLEPLHDARTRAHGANRGTCSQYATDHTQRDGQWLLKHAKAAAPAVYGKFGPYMAAIVNDIPHITRALQEGLYAYHLDAGTVKLLISDTISRLLHPEAALTAYDMLLLQRANALSFSTPVVETPSPTAEEAAKLRSYVDDADAGTPLDTILGVYMERIIASGSLSAVPRVAVGICRHYIVAGLAQALPWKELMCERRREAVVDMAVAAFHLDKAYVAGWVGAPTPPRLIINRFISTVMGGDAEFQLPLKNHLDAVHLCAELGNIAGFYHVERSLSKAGGEQLAADIEHLMAGGIPERRETRAQAALRRSAAAAHRRITTTDLAHVSTMQAHNAVGAGVTNTEKFCTALQRLVNPGNVRLGTGEHLLAHRLVGALAASMVQRASTHGTTAAERVSLCLGPLGRSLHRRGFRAQFLRHAGCVVGALA